MLLGDVDDAVAVIRLAQRLNTYLILARTLKFCLPLKGELTAVVDESGVFQATGFGKEGIFRRLGITRCVL